MLAATVDHKDNYRKLRERMFDILGNRCAQCGSPPLYVRHRAGHANSDRARFKKSANTMMRYYIIRPEEAREKLQLLCSKCSHKDNKNKKHRHYYVLANEHITLMTRFHPDLECNKCHDEIKLIVGQEICRVSYRSNGSLKSNFFHGSCARLLGIEESP